MSSFASRLPELAEEATSLLRSHATESGEHALARQGGSAQLLSGMLKLFRDTWETKAAKNLQSWWEPFTDVFKDPDLSKQAVQQMDKGVAATHPRANFAALHSSNLLDGLYHEYSSIPGTKPAPRVKGSYFPRFLPDSLFEGAARKKMIDHLIATGQAPNAARADKILNWLSPKNPVHGRFHHLDSPRTYDLPGYREDIGVIADYITGASRRITEARMFGPKGEVLDEVLSNIRAESGENVYQYASTLASNFLGRNSSHFRGKLEQAIVSGETTTKLGLAMISHVSQPINNVLVAGIKPFASALLDAFRDHGDYQSFGLRSGAALMDTISEIRRITGAENEKLGSKVLHYTGFMPYDKIRRIFSANIGKHFAEDEFSRLVESKGASPDAKRHLSMLGVNWEQALKLGKLTDDDLLQAGKRLSDITQFRTSALELPLAWKTKSWVRMATMYKPFFFNQARFIKDYVFLEALKHRNYKPLLYMSILFPTLGEITTDIKMGLRGKLDERPNWEKYPYDRILQNVANVGAFGIMADTVNAFSSGAPAQLYAFLTGPVVGDVVETGQLAVQLAKGNVNALERAVIRRIPTIGPALSRVVIPSKHHKPGFLESGKLTKGLKKAVEVFTP